MDPGVAYLRGSGLLGQTGLVSQQQHTAMWKKHVSTKSKEIYIYKKCLHEPK